MADDIFLTPEEQDERARKWLKENGPALAIGIALGLGAIFGWNQYKAKMQRDAETASELYTAAIEEVRSSQLSDIDVQLAELKEAHSDSPYAAKVALLKAKQLSVSDLPAAFNELQWVMDNAEEMGLIHTARIRQAKIKMELGEYDAAKKLAGHTPTQGFDSYYSELLGDIAAKEGDTDAARSNYQTAIDALTSGQSSYSRVLTLKLDRLPELKVDSAESDTPSTANQSTNVESAEQSVVQDKQ